MSMPAKATLASAVAIVLASFVTMLTGVLPTIAFVLLALLAPLGKFAWLGLLLPPLVYLLWHPSLLYGAEEPPIRTSVLAALIGLGQIPWFYASWDYGVRYWGFWFCVAVLAANVAMAGILVFVERRARHEPSFGNNLLLHALTFGWLMTIAFPYLGELP